MTAHALRTAASDEAEIHLDFAELGDLDWGLIKACTALAARTPTLCDDKSQRWSIDREQDDGDEPPHLVHQRVLSLHLVDAFYRAIRNSAVLHRPGLVNDMPEEHPIAGVRVTRHSDRSITLHYSQEARVVVMSVTGLVHSYAIQRIGEPSLDEEAAGIVGADGMPQVNASPGAYAEQLQRETEELKRRTKSLSNVIRRIFDER